MVTSTPASCGSLSSLAHWLSISRVSTPKYEPLPKTYMRLMVVLVRARGTGAGVGLGAGAGADMGACGAVDCGSLAAGVAGCAGCVGIVAGPVAPGGVGGGTCAISDVAAASVAV